jgi:hypothetical protein
MEKELSKITREEWIKYQWFDATQMGDTERMMGRAFLRTPDESYQAMMEWDETAEERMEPEDEKGTVQ